MKVKKSRGEVERRTHVRGSGSPDAARRGPKGHVSEESQSKQARNAAARAVDVVAAITSLAEPIVRDLGLMLDRIEYVDRGRSAVVRVFIDRAGGGAEGVGIGDCVEVTRELSPTLDVHDVVPKRYTLEVSSPGLDRPLAGAEDFRRFAGRRAALTLRRAVEGGSKLVGVLKGVGDGGIGFELNDGRLVTIPLELIAKARLEP